MLLSECIIIDHNDEVLSWPTDKIEKRALKISRESEDLLQQFAPISLTTRWIEW